MPRYEIRPKRPTLIAGRTVTQEDVIAHVACDLPVRNVLSMVQFGGASVTEIIPEVKVKASKPPVNETETKDETTEVTEETETTDEPTSDFSDYSAKVQAGLAEAGITTLAQAALYFRDHGSFVPLSGIGTATSKLIVKQIEAAGIPTS